MDMTLRKVCDTFNVSRRAIQGYEKAELISASGKNEYGHLLYNESVQKRIERIKLYQQMGFTIKEIKGIIDAPDDVLKSQLEKQVKKLKEKRENVELLIIKVNKLIETL